MDDGKSKAWDMEVFKCLVDLGLESSIKWIFVNLHHGLLQGIAVEPEQEG